MELHELRLPDLERAVMRGRIRQLRQGPRSLRRVLDDISAEMDEQDVADMLASDPLLWLQVSQRQRRRRLWDRLFR